jgi:hypothetical protein
MIRKNIEKPNIIMLNQRWFSIIIKSDIVVKAIGEWFHNNFKVGF